LPKIDVTIVEDDQAVRRATDHLLRLLGYTTTSFASAEDFLNSGCACDTACLVTDVRLPGMNGAELQARLISEGHSMPIVFVTAFPDEGLRSILLRSGAVCYLSKPLQEQRLLDCIERALKQTGRFIA
jgi:FixJ family two-component response regulator